jgi:murein DD-endopeptidase MepM/ murein hydrolase activator NlpD
LGAGKLGAGKKSRATASLVPLTGWLLPLKKKVVRAKPAVPASNEVVIDVMVAYTRKAAENYTDIKRELIQLAIEEGNQSFAMSNLGHVKLRLVHAYETDFRQRVRAGDAFQLFFDMKEDDKGAEGELGELLATSITSSGETHKFYRYRTPDGAVDYYDEQGNTSRKFLMRRPVRGEDVRITSGYGLRRHPVLQISRMHTGVDWATAQGTPIMAAGSGVIEEAGRKGEYGNYIRIRHANGYKTAYGHMLKFAPGVTPGVKVRQGQVIGYVGTTGLSSGPHVHFEVLVNNSFVDPMSIHVPRERQLEGKQLADFQKERLRIDEIMRRNPVSTKVATVGGGGVR